MRDDVHTEILRAATELAAAATDERGEIVTLLAAVVESQRHIVELLTEVAGDLDSLRAAPARRGQALRSVAARATAEASARRARG
jgi:hypothetical protein